MSTDINLSKPEPIILNKQLELFNRTSDVKLTIKALEAGKPVLITEFYSNGLLLLKALKIYLQKKLPNSSFQEQREYRAEYNKLSNLIYVEIVAHNLILKKSPSIGWLKKLYPESSDFLLTFPQIQGLNSAWQWYKNGISVPVLRNKIHPYYGTYFPTRFDHLILFDNWLKRYDGHKKTAIDVGIGSGILSFQMIKYGFQKVFGTDTNPNAIVGLIEYMGDTKLSRKIELDVASLFGKFEKQTELIVFNPPWLPKSHDLDRIDEAIYYDENLFPDFFEGAKQRLLPDGKLVLLFSNLAQITNVSKEHPIEKELAEGGRFQLDNYLKKTVKSASNKTKRDQHWRALEEVELWVLINK
ncbi:methyltransferase [Ulvibacter antarcticus]|uniref:Ribosomal protein L11 methyltransferase PrmA n=1 Tax=Ulvibacter antarcticus TaxID=442714 RepID=A0A3L9YYC6_9FLAO|nr:methyltransferase [Ulvibacter antarcticus]RMA64807.1 ribosomal protein L11 methyltransferase PrmA [Ulvibacter antarcticus]